jgi:hypothetical protein
LSTSRRGRQEKCSRICLKAQKEAEKIVAMIDASRSKHRKRKKKKRETSAKLQPEITNQKSSVTKRFSADRRRVRPYQYQTGIFFTREKRSVVVEKK